MSSPRSGLVPGMGQDDAVIADRNSFSGHGQLDDDDDSPPPQSSSKVLTLPTVLTLGRVAAVPLLVASTLISRAQFPVLLKSKIRHTLAFYVVHGVWIALLKSSKLWESF